MTYNFRKSAPKTYPAFSVMVPVPFFVSGSMVTLAGMMTVKSSTIETVRRTYDVPDMLFLSS